MELGLVCQRAFPWPVYFQRQRDWAEPGGFSHREIATVGPGRPQYALHPAMVPGSLCAGHLENLAAADAELRRPVGALVSDYHPQWRDLQLRPEPVYQRRQEHGLQERSGRYVLARGSWVPGQPGDFQPLEQLWPARGTCLGSEGRRTHDDSRVLRVRL